MMRDILALCLLYAMSSAIQAQQARVGDPGGLPSIREHTSGMTKSEGYLTFYYDNQEGNLWLEISRWNQDLLYGRGLATGVGLRSLSLDRGQITGPMLVQFQRFGRKVFLVGINSKDRTTSNDEDQQRSVKESFSHGVLWGFTVAAEEADTVLVDATSFFLRDAFDVVSRLQRANAGNYSMDLSRSAINPDRTKNFPNNTEVDSIVTFTGKPAVLSGEAFSPREITVRQHQSFISLPGEGFSPRPYDPRSGLWTFEYTDYGAPIGATQEKRFIPRHRLAKINPSAEYSQPVEPVTYFVDRGIPEPIRSAVMEGVLWWNEAFEAIGYRNAVQVQLLPEEADPMDLRYNTIHWFHRDAPGGYYANVIVDPRTGEIINGYVNLGSQRIRAMYSLAEILLSSSVPPEQRINQLEEFVLAHIRQIAAHEVGHSLGIAHNYSLERVSVMGRPTPLIAVQSGDVDISDAYMTGLGEWDRVPIAYAYQDLPDGEEPNEVLNSVVQSAIDRGLPFISDLAGNVHPLTNNWEGVPLPFARWSRVTELRSTALSRFSQENVRPGSPMSLLEEKLYPIFFLHRNPTGDLARLLGGRHFAYAVRGETRTISEIVPPDLQRTALDALFSTIKPEFLAIPMPVLDLIPPPAYGYFRPRAPRFVRRSGSFLDPISAAESSAHLTIRLLLDVERATRLIEFHARDSEYPGFQEVVDGLLEVTWKQPKGSGYLSEIGRAVDNVVLYRLMKVAVEGTTPVRVKVVAWSALDDLKQWLSEQMDVVQSEDQSRHVEFSHHSIDSFQNTHDVPKFLDEPLMPATFPDNALGACSRSLNWFPEL